MRIDDNRYRFAAPQHEDARLQVTDLYDAPCLNQYFL
jgi:hypothetical protein